ncbi:MAG TPA: hypothetical protein VM327_08905 [Candidatus Thermoplasmatota archaeon]|nr:hypothetical protein [Candidatus Thermoplasmatota archaeon]
MAGGFLLASQFVAAGLLLLLAVALLAVKFDSRVNRAFALYLMLEGLAILLLNIARLEGETDPNDLWLRLTYYPSVMLPIALLYFLVVYRRPLGGPAVRAAGITAVLLAGAVGILHALDPCASACLDGNGSWRAGILTAFYGLKTLALGVVALVLALDVLRGRAGPRSRAVLLVSGAFGLLAFFDAGLVVFLVATEPLHSGYVAGPWIAAARLLALPAVVVAMAALGVVARCQARDGLSHPARILVLVLMALASVAFVAIPADSASGNLGTLLAGTWRTLVPAVVAYALVRHRLFDVEVKVRASLVFALVAAVYGGTYFLVSEGLEAVVSSRFGALGGLVAAALLTLLARPITDAARRLAAFLVPGLQVKPTAPIADREAIYRSQFLLLMEDGTLTTKERRLLDQLRGHLGIPVARARRMENAIGRETLDAPATRPAST